MVEIRDGNHEGTSVWLRERGDYCFASHDRNTLETAERCVLLAGQDVENVEEPYGCDLESPRGLVMLGTHKDDDLGWISEGAEVLWDSRARAVEATGAA